MQHVRYGNTKDIMEQILYNRVSVPEELVCPMDLF